MARTAFVFLLLVLVSALGGKKRETKPILGFSIYKDPQTAIASRKAVGNLVGEVKERISVQPRCGCYVIFYLIPSPVKNQDLLFVFVGRSPYFAGEKRLAAVLLGKFSLAEAELRMLVRHIETAILRECTTETANKKLARVFKPGFFYTNAFKINSSNFFLGVGAGCSAGKPTGNMATGRTVGGRAKVSLTIFSSKAPTQQEANPAASAASCR